MESKNICVICSGNICRSPFVEHILRRELGTKHHIFSVGLLGIWDAPAYEVCVELAPEYSVDLSSHLSQGATAESVAKSHYLLGMTSQHTSGIRMYPVQGEVKLFSEYLPAGEIYSLGSLGKIKPGDDILDPMGQPAEVVKPVLDVLELAAVCFAKELKEQEQV